jgi:hypothetical protein
MRPVAVGEEVWICTFFFFRKMDKNVAESLWLWNIVDY